MSDIVQKVVGPSAGAAEGRFRLLGESMPQIVWTARADGTVDYFNPKIADCCGLRRDPDGTWRWEALVHPED